MPNCCFPFPVCCPPLADGSPDPRHLAALAEQMEKWKSSRPASVPLVRWFAERLLAMAELAPLGTTKAAIDGWASPPIARAQVIGEKLVDLYAAAFAERDQAG